VSWECLTFQGTTRTKSSISCLKRVHDAMKADPWRCDARVAHEVGRAVVDKVEFDGRGRAVFGGARGRHSAQTGRAGGGGHGGGEEVPVTRKRTAVVGDVHAVAPQNATSADEVDDTVAHVTLVVAVAGGQGRLGPRDYVLHLVLGWAVKTGRIAVNPAGDVPLPRKAPSDHVYLTRAQMVRLTEHAGAYRVLVPLLAHTGLRWGEASALQARPVDLVRRRALSTTWPIGSTLSGSWRWSGKPTRRRGTTSEAVPRRVQNVYCAATASVSHSA
jgi:hypothetical protein